MDTFTRTTSSCTEGERVHKEKLFACFSFNIYHPVATTHEEIDVENDTLITCLPSAHEAPSSYRPLLYILVGGHC